jgi:hypothetical protein
MMAAQIRGSSPGAVSHARMAAAISFRMNWSGTFARPLSALLGWTS